MKYIKQILKPEILLLITIILIGAFFRLINIDWGEGDFFHPDERNIATGVINLDFEKGDYNPDFFAYGSLPIYIIYFFSGKNFAEAILVGRYMSAILSILIIPLVYLIIRKLIEGKEIRAKGVNVLPLLGALLTAFNVGLIQFAHFTTFEIYLSITYLGALYYAIDIIKGRNSAYILSSIMIGIAIATKIVSLAIVPIILTAQVIRIFREANIPHLSLIHLKKFLDLRLIIFSLALIVITTIVFFPYLILDYEHFRGSMNYEGPVASGELLVFYTQQFVGTIPFVYQVFSVFPYILGWPLTLISLISLAIGLFFAIKNILFSVNKFTPSTLVLLMILLYGGAHMIMFVKWTRYMIPLLPLLIIYVLVLLTEIRWRKKFYSRTMIGILFLTSIHTIVMGADYSTIYTMPDPRVEAGKYLSSIIGSNNEKALLETADIGTGPIAGPFGSQNVMYIDIYNIDQEKQENAADFIAGQYANVDYIIIASNRTYATKLRLADENPATSQYYKELFKGELGFELINEINRDTPLEQLMRDYRNQSLYDLLNPDIFTADETFTVFDRPRILIFRRYN